MGLTSLRLIHREVTQVVGNVGEKDPRPAAAEEDDPKGSGRGFHHPQHAQSDRERNGDAVHADA